MEPSSLNPSDLNISEYTVLEVLSLLENEESYRDIARKAKVSPIL